ncbi:MAG: hypothetical protein ACI8XM_002904, partial [Haloarculaceae archaeon]
MSQEVSEAKSVSTNLAAEAFEDGNLRDVLLGEQVPVDAVGPALTLGTDGTLELGLG